jgi:hypothetical protein
MSRATGIATQIQLAGQFASLSQVLVLGWQLPGKDVVVVHDGCGSLVPAS